MKNRIIALLAIIAVFGLAIYAYAQTTSVNSERSCCTKDSCPMKKKDAPGDSASCCDQCDCCKDGKCTGDSCPMKKKDGEAKVTSVSASEEGKNCCDNCACCKGKHGHNV